MAFISGIICFTTSNYDAMTRFCRDIGMEVMETRNQLVPLFNQGRGAAVTIGDVSFNLEESTSGPAVAAFNLMLLEGYTEADIERFRQLGYQVAAPEVSFYGTFYTIKSPDGGIITIAT